ncbi:MAG: hypothetical protein AAF242_13095, partial [Bacteroidota bacterium]
LFALWAVQTFLINQANAGVLSAKMVCTAHRANKAIKPLRKAGPPLSCITALTAKAIKTKPHQGKKLAVTRLSTRIVMK